MTVRLSFVAIGIEMSLTQPGVIDLYFADVATILTDAGSAMIGIGEGWAGGGAA